MPEWDTAKAQAPSIQVLTEMWEGRGQDGLRLFAVHLLSKCSTASLGLVLAKIISLSAMRIAVYAEMEIVTWIGGALAAATRERKARVLIDGLVSFALTPDLAEVSVKARVVKDPRSSRRHGVLADAKHASTWAFVWGCMTWHA